MALLDDKAIGKRLSSKRLELFPGISSRKYAMDAGIDSSQYAKIEKGDLPITDNIMDKLVATYGLNKNYILHGINVPQETTTVEDNPNYLKKRLALKNGEEKTKVPVYGGYTTLGNIEVIDDANVKHRVVAELPTDVFPGCDYAEKAKGDSMYPLIMNQALLVGKRCPVDGIAYGEKYIIKTRKGLDTTKFVHPGSTEKKIKLKAYNKSIPDQEINIEDVVFVCRVHWIVNPT